MKIKWSVLINEAIKVDMEVHEYIYQLIRENKDLEIEDDIRKI